MARYVGPVCKLCRREGMKLYLKGERCYSEKCSVTRRPYPPGQHGQGRVKLSEYAVRLREKQKMRRIYGVLERQFRIYYHDANRSKGRTGEEMLAILERRLDNAIYRGGFAASRAEARQVVRHGHVKINGKRVDIPSYQVRSGEKIELTDNARKFGKVGAAIAGAEKRNQASWFEVDRANFTMTIKGAPPREDLNEPEVREQLVVEYYSR
ncbi:MAG: 30S ribosomal protein S4 [Polyangiaceae bacterium]|nr:30S ribosomal protein S4 [Polyangiaceae bacterium]